MEWNKQKIKGLLLVVCGGVAFYCALQRLDAVLAALGWLLGILAPFLLGGALAFILNVPMRAIERHLFPRNRKGAKLRRPLALVLTLVAVIGGLALAGLVIGPGIADAVMSIIREIPAAFQRLEHQLTALAENLQDLWPLLEEQLMKLQEEIQWQELSAKALEIAKAIGAGIVSSGGFIGGVVSGVSTFVISLIFSFYVLLQKEKLGRLYLMKGKKTEEVKELTCGDIGAIGKMEKVKTGDTLSDPRKVVKLEPIPFPEPCYSVAITPKTKGQEDKIAQGLARINEEDPTFSVTNNAETHQMVLNGSGDMQVDVLVSKLKSRFNVEADLKPVRVPYREKIRKTVQKQGRHKKQTGGHGQFGDVWIRFEPQTEQDDMIFAEEVFGGSGPKNFFPAVEKGLREACAHGPLAGYPVVNLKAVLNDGSYHPMDSSENAFKTAAQLAYKAALPEANPVLLEPVGELKVTVPDSYMGDVIGDLNKRRGRVMGMDPTGDGNQVISAEVPMAEMGSYAIDLRSMTQSRGSFTFHFVRYEDCPPAAQEKAIAEAKALQAAEEK